jgi:hypothetical protein
MVGLMLLITLAVLSAINRSFSLLGQVILYSGVMESKAVIQGEELLASRRMDPQQLTEALFQLARHNQERQQGIGYLENSVKRNKADALFRRLFQGIFGSGGGNSKKNEDAPTEDVTREDSKKDLARLGLMVETQQGDLEATLSSLSDYNGGMLRQRKPSPQSTAEGSTLSHGDKEANETTQLKAHDHGV